MTEVWIKFGYRVGDLPCFTAFLFFGPYLNFKFTIYTYAFLFFGHYSNLKFIIFTYTCLVTIFCNIIVLMNLWIPRIKRKKAPNILNIIVAIELSMLPRHDVHLDLIADEFCFHYSDVLPVNHRYIQRIVRATSPRSMNVGAQCKNCKQFSLQN